MVKPDSARMVTEHLVMLAQSGKLRSKIDGAQLVNLLEQVQAASKPTKIKFQRKGEDDIVLGERSADKKTATQSDSDSDNFDTSSDENVDDRDEDEE